MELTGKLKEQVEKTETKEEAKEVIKETMEDAGMILSDEELDQVAGGYYRYVFLQSPEATQEAMKEGNTMELTKELKEKVEKAETKEEAKKILKDAGVELTEEELDKVSGGIPLVQP